MHIGMSLAVLSSPASPVFKCIYALWIQGMLLKLPCAAEGTFSAEICNCCLHKRRLDGLYILYVAMGASISLKQAWYFVCRARLTSTCRLKPNELPKLWLAGQHCWNGLVKLYIFTDSQTQSTAFLVALVSAYHRNVGTAPFSGKRVLQRPRRLQVQLATQ